MNKNSKQILLLIIVSFLLIECHCSHMTKSTANPNGCTDDPANCIIYDITTGRSKCTEINYTKRGGDFSSLDINLDFQKFKGRIVAYKIQWFNGSWSDWYIPGYNDIDTKAQNGRLRRVWSYFSDHSFKIILCKN